MSKPDESLQAVTGFPPPSFDSDSPSLSLNKYDYYGTGSALYLPLGLPKEMVIVKLH